MEPHFPAAAWQLWPDGDIEPLLPDAYCTAAQLHARRAHQVAFPGANPPLTNAGFAALYAGSKEGEAAGFTNSNYHLSSLHPAECNFYGHRSLIAPSLPSSPSGHFLRDSRLSADDYHAYQDVDMERAATLPAGGASLSARAYLPHLLRQPSKAADPALGFRARLLSSMPMGQGRAGTRLPSGRGRQSAEATEVQKARRAAADSEASHRLKNRDAQRRFRQRQRESISSSQKAVEDLEKQLQQLTWEVQQERANGRGKMDIMLLENSHIKRLAIMPEVRDAERVFLSKQFKKLLDLLHFESEGAEEWRVQDWIDFFAKKLLPKLKELLSQRGTDEATDLLREVVTLRRRSLARLARFSCWHWLLYGWNLDFARDILPGNWPKLDSRIELLDSLGLSTGQEDALLKAHAQLRQQLAAAVQEKHQILELLGKMQAAAAEGRGESQAPGCAPNVEGSEERVRPGSDGCAKYGGFKVEGVDWGPCGPSLRALRRFLEGLRWAIYSFLFTVLDLTLTPEQEAILDLSYPFSPDWHTMLCVLSLRRQELPVTQAAVDALALPDLTLTNPALAPLMPVVTALDLFLRPSTCTGMGSRLIYGIVANPYHTIDSAELWKVLPISELRPMRLIDAVKNSWQIGHGAPFHWLGLAKDYQDPSSLEPHERAAVRRQ